MENQKNKGFFTSDIKIASFLLSKGVSLCETERHNSRKVIFIFERSDKTTSLIKDYLTDKAIVNPRLLFESFENLKSIIFEEIKL